MIRTIHSCILCNEQKTAYTLFKYYVNLNAITIYVVDTHCFLLLLFNVCIYTRMLLIRPRLDELHLTLAI